MSKPKELDPQILAERKAKRKAYRTQWMRDWRAKNRQHYNQYMRDYRHGKKNTPSKSQRQSLEII